jgi:ADP-heptose:LPS heptosyltransferase
MRLLVIRISSMGDVALTLPACRAVLEKYPEVSITVVTASAFLPLFEGIDRLTAYPADIRRTHKGLKGLYRLYRELQHHASPDRIIDLHDVLRSHILSGYFRLNGTPVFRIDKGRKEKKALTARYHKVFTPLPHSVERYLDTFSRAGFTAELPARRSWFSPRALPGEFLHAEGIWQKTRPWIGIAPFAKHPEKRWPLEKMKQFIAAYPPEQTDLFLFGGGAQETAVFHNWKKDYPHLHVVAGALTLSDELGLIARLDQMVCMDSANMHLAALSNIAVVSIWGATHTYAGFGPLNGNEKYTVEIPHTRLTCRPCSVFGNKPCFRGDHACMRWIDPEEVRQMSLKALGDHQGSPFQ